MNLALPSALAALIAYALINILVSHKLSGVSAVSTIPFFGIMMSTGAAIVFLICKARGIALITPAIETHGKWILIIGVLYAVAEMLFLGAYNLKGASLPLITTMAALLPVFVSVIDKVFMNGQIPSKRTILAFLLTFVVVWLVAYDPANSTGVG